MLQPGLILHEARTTAGIGLRELARRAGTSHPTLSQYERGQKTPTASVFFRILTACGYAPDVELSRRIRTSNGITRGQELEEALDLAEQFPANPSRKLPFPRFGS